MVATQLKIANENNKLNCPGFIQIHFAPKAPIRESELERIYEINTAEGNILVKVVDILRIRFHNIGNLFTIPATGMEYLEWQRDWQRKYPQTKKDTEMAIYCYKRV